MVSIDSNFFFSDESRCGRFKEKRIGEKNARYCRLIRNALDSPR